MLAALADPIRLAAVRTLAGLGDSPCTELHHAAGLDTPDAYLVDA